MANPTTNYGWPMPTATDLVTDLPADFAAFGQPVDNSLKALNPETTLGDIAYRSATANTNTRLPIGTSGQVLAVSGGVPAWTTASSGSMTQLASGTLSGTSVSLTSISQSYKDLKLVVTELNATNAMISIRTNTNTSSDYSYVNIRNGGAFVNATAASRILTGASADANTGKSSNVIIFNNYAQATSVIPINYYAVSKTSSQGSTGLGVGYWTGTLAAITSIQIEAQGDTMSGGSYVLYGVN